LQNSFSRHSGVGQNQVKTIVYWMLAYASMTIKMLNQSFLKCWFKQIFKNSIGSDNGNWRKKFVIPESRDLYYFVDTG